MTFARSLIASTALFVFATAAHAADAPSFNLSITDHKFTPASIIIPANTKVVLHVKNNDSTAEEFESDKLSREKVIPANSEGIVNIGPLEAGTYPFDGEYHEDTAKGEIVVK